MPEMIAKMTGGQKHAPGPESGAKYSASPVSAGAQGMESVPTMNYSASPVQGIFGIGHFKRWLRNRGKRHGAKVLPGDESMGSESGSASRPAFAGSAGSAGSFVPAFDELSGSESASEISDRSITDSDLSSTSGDELSGTQTLGGDSSSGYWDDPTKEEAEQVAQEMKEYLRKLGLA